MRKRSIKRLCKHFPVLYNWLEKLIYPKVINSYVKVDFVRINRKDLIDEEILTTCQVRFFTINNIFTLFAQLPSTNYSSGWVRIFQTVKSQVSGKKNSSTLDLLDGDYTIFTLNRFAQEITHLEGNRYPIKTIIGPN